MGPPAFSPQHHSINQREKIEPPYAATFGYGLKKMLRNRSKNKRELSRQHRVSIMKKYRKNGAPWKPKVRRTIRQ
jgi:hypothetical protein